MRRPPVVPMYLSLIWIVLSVLLSTPMSATGQDSDESVLFARIIKPNVRIRRDYVSNSEMVAVGDRGQEFRVLDYTEEALKIAYPTRNQQGDYIEAWIDRRHAKLVRRRPGGIAALLRKHAQLIAIVTGGLVALVILILLIRFIVRRLMTRAAAKIASHRELLIVANRPKDIRNSLSGATSTIDRCFSQVGFSIVHVRSADAFEQRVRGKRPDVVVVDWEFVPDIADSIEFALASDVTTASVPVIYYDVPAGVAESRRPRIRDVHYLGADIADRDLFRIIQEHTTVGLTQTALVRRGEDESAAMEGDIGEGGLSAILQLIEIGQKNGALLVDQEGPYGMIFFEMGNPVYVATKENKGEKALYELLDLKTGNFRFANDKRPPERNCTMSTMGALMEWARVSDENRRD